MRIAARLVDFFSGMIGNDGSGITLHRFHCRLNTLFNQVELADDFRIAAVFGDAAKALSGRIVVDNYAPFGIENSQFSAGHAILRQTLEEARDDFLNEAEIGEVDPNADYRANLVTHRCCKRQNVTIRTIKFSDD